MADDDTNLPADYDLIPVDRTPQFADAPVPKAGQTIQQPNVMGDISSMPGKVASAVGDVTGVSDAYKAATGQMTPEEAQMFALGALPMLAGGPEAKAVGEVASDIAPEVAKGIRAFHGSPYDFNQFDLSKIGTGEGAQAYGHGLYFAENPGVAGTYKRPGMHSYIQESTIDDTPVSRFSPNSLVEARAVDALKRNPTVEEAVKYLQQDSGTDEAQNWLTTNAGRIKDANQIGKMYEVNINADPEHFLDWDKPLSEQSDQVKNTLAQRFGVAPVDKLQWSVVPSSEGRGFRVVNQLGGETGGALYERDAQKIADNANARPAQSWDPTGKEVYDHIIRKQEPQFGEFHSVRETTPVLRDAGIPGIKYLDRGSRTQGTGTKNYVVFSDDLIQILRKYGMAGLGVGLGAEVGRNKSD